mmetsp:Transcript_29450/g.84631  ORF Transcript_29450/g.84631 Transcript_29450/m.84631 type:complete len:245 (+) Transcript_29450:190-924(+)
MSSLARWEPDPCRKPGRERAPAPRWTLQPPPRCLRSCCGAGEAAASPALLALKHHRPGGLRGGLGTQATALLHKVRERYLRAQAAVDQAPRNRGVRLRPEGLAAPLPQPLARSRGGVLQRSRAERLLAMVLLGPGLGAGGDELLRVGRAPEGRERRGGARRGELHMQQLRRAAIRQAQLPRHARRQLGHVLLTEAAKVVELHHVRVGHAEGAELLVVDVGRCPLSRGQGHGLAEGAEIGLGHVR